MNFRQVEMYINYQKCIKKNERSNNSCIRKKYKNIYGTVNAYSTDSMQRIKLRETNYHTYIHIYVCVFEKYTNFEF